MLWILVAIAGGIVAGFLTSLAPDADIHRPMSFAILWILLLSLWGTIIKVRQVRANPEAEIIQALVKTDSSEHTPILNEADAVRTSWWHFLRLTLRFFRSYVWFNAMIVAVAAGVTFWLRRLP